MDVDNVPHRILDLTAWTFKGSFHGSFGKYIPCLSFNHLILIDFLFTVKAAPHECVIRTGQP